jgi:membrane-bound serine protease (ClpP class)
MKIDMKISVLIFTFLVVCLKWENTQAQDSTHKKVFVMQIRSEIDPRTSRYVEKALHEAKKQQVSLIIIDMDTYGGMLNSADEIRSNLLECEIPIYVYINKNAASAGALIAIACDSIYMSAGASIGAATVVSGNDGMPVPEKYQSYMRSLMRSTAEASGRNPDIAEAMVGTKDKLDTLKDENEVLTFTTEEAIKNGFCEGKMKTMQDLFDHHQLNDYQRIDYELSGVEKVIAIFLNPYISSILILIIIGGIYFELQTPGVGFPLIASITAAILYFVPYYLNGLAEYWEAILFIIGVALLVVELIIIPGFGIFGISGIALMFTSLLLIMIGNDWFNFEAVPETTFIQSFIAVTVGIVGGVIVIFVGAMQLANSRFFMKKFALQPELTKEAGYSVRLTDENIIGKEGIAYTVLRPSGKVMIEGKIYDAMSQVGWIEAGEKIKVLQENVNNLLVTKTD